MFSLNIAETNLLDVSSLQIESSMCAFMCIVASLKTSQAKHQLRPGISQRFIADGALVLALVPLKIVPIDILIIMEVHSYSGEVALPL